MQLFKSVNWRSAGDLKGLKNQKSKMWTREFSTDHIFLT